MSDNLYNFWEEKYKNMNYIPDYIPDSLISYYFEYMPKGKVLDLGIGQGKNSLFFAANDYKIVGVDISEIAVQKLRKIAEKENLNMDLKTEDIRKFEFYEDEYEIIISTAVLHYFRKHQTEEIIKNMIKGLKTGGFVYISVFSCDDSGFKTQLENKKVQVVGENEIFIPESGIYRSYFSKDEVLDYFKGIELISISETKFLDLTHGETHYHAEISYLGRNRV